jgi:hypothetical protein
LALGGQLFFPAQKGKLPLETSEEVGIADRSFVAVAGCDHLRLKIPIALP